MTFKIIKFNRGFIGKRTIAGIVEFFDGAWKHSFGGPPECVVTQPFPTEGACNNAILKDEIRAGMDRATQQNAINARTAADRHENPSITHAVNVDQAILDGMAEKIRESLLHSPAWNPSPTITPQLLPKKTCYRITYGIFALECTYLNDDSTVHYAPDKVTPAYIEHEFSVRGIMRGKDAAELYLMIDNATRVFKNAGFPFEVQCSHGYEWGSIWSISPHPATKCDVCNIVKATTNAASYSIKLNVVEKIDPPILMVIDDPHTAPYQAWGEAKKSANEYFAKQMQSMGIPASVINQPEGSYGEAHKSRFVFERLSGMKLLTR